MTETQSLLYLTTRSSITNQNRYQHLMKLLKAHRAKNTRVGVLLLEDSVIALRNPYCPLHELAKEGVEFYVGKEDAVARHVPALLTKEDQNYKPKLVSKREAIRLIFDFDRLINWG